MNVPMTNERKPIQLPADSHLSTYSWQPADGFRLQQRTGIQFLPDAGALHEGPDLVLVELPHEQDLHENVVSGLQAWTEQGSDPLERRCGLLQLQGCRIFWGPGRVILAAAPRRLDSARAALLEAIAHDSRLRKIEQWLEQGWEQLQSDLEPAFEFNERQLRQRSDLRKRYEEVIANRAELVRLNPRLHFPPIYPPTLASQIGERIRERTRLVERAEFASQQLEVYERVYEQAGERRNEFLLQRSSNQLEWVIILLLVAQIILVLVEMLGGQGAN